MEHAPQHCPGTESADAGKLEVCAGCPNQKICASSEPAKPDPDLEIIKEKLSTVKHIVLVLSGKGGVGKSTFTSILAHALAEDPSRNVGVMDIDICGPSMPRMFGVENEQVHLSGSGWSPVYIEENLSMMSVGFLLSGPDEAVIWRGPKKNGLIKQFLKDVDWGELDYLVIDTPPGTSDEHMSIVQYLKGTNLDGALIVTTPQEVSLLDVRKEIDFCNKVGLPVLGVVENMSGFMCPKCEVVTDIFPAKTGGGRQMAKDLNIPFLGNVPLNSQIGKATDEGRSFLSDENPKIIAPIRTIIKNLLQVTETTNS